MGTGIPLRPVRNLLTDWEAVETAARDLFATVAETWGRDAARTLFEKIGKDVPGPSKGSHRNPEEDAGLLAFHDTQLCSLTEHERKHPVPPIARHWCDLNKKQPVREAERKAVETRLRRMLKARAASGAAEATWCRLLWGSETPPPTILDVPAPRARRATRATKIGTRSK